MALGQKRLETPWSTQTNIVKSPWFSSFFYADVSDISVFPTGPQRSTWFKLVAVRGQQSLSVLVNRPVRRVLLAVTFQWKPALVFVRFKHKIFVFHFFPSWRAGAASSIPGRKQTILCWVPAWRITTTIFFLHKRSLEPGYFLYYEGFQKVAELESEFFLCGIWFLTTPGVGFRFFCLTPTPCPIGSLFMSHS